MGGKKFVDSDMDGQIYHLNISNLIKNSYKIFKLFKRIVRGTMPYLDINIRYHKKIVFLQKS